MGAKSKHSCPDCDAQYSSLNTLARHRLKHDKPEVFFCTICIAPFETMEACRIHRREIHQQFNEKHEYLVHAKHQHAGNVDSHFICEACGTQFQTKLQLRFHVDSNCGTEKRFKCDICNRRYQAQASLRVHQLSHQTGKKELCSFCGASFQNRGQLKVHVRAHTGEKPYKCDRCDKAFGYRESLITHYTTHTGVKPFTCKCCNARFSCVGNLIKHRKLRPQTCGLPEYRPTKREAPRPTKKTMPSLSDKPRKTPGMDTKTVSSTEGEEKYSTHVNFIVKSEPDEDNSDNQLNNVEEKERIKLEVLVEFANDDIKSEPEDEQCELLEVIETNEDQFHEENIGQDSNYSEREMSEDELENHELDYRKQSKMTLGDEQGNDKTYTTAMPRIMVPSEQTICLKVVSWDGLKKGGNDQSPNGEKVYITLDERFENDQRQTEKGKQSSTVNDSKGKTCFSSETISPQKEQQPRTSKRRANKKTKVETKPTEENTEISAEQLNEMKIEKEDPKLHEQLELIRQNSETSLNLFCCKLCPLQYTSKYLIARHLERHHNFQLDKARQKLQFKKGTARERQFRCKYCDRSYVNVTRLKLHIGVHGADGRLRHKCSGCARYFETQEMARQHALEQHRARLVCDDCDKQFKDPEALQYHVRYVHDGQNKRQKLKYMCHICGKYLPSRTSLSDHERTNCGKSPLHRCETCGKHYASFNSLKVHRTMHENQLPYQCAHCVKRFRTKGQLTVHERSHTGDKPFRCEYCPKTFPYRESLLAHRVAHTGIKRFACSGCGKGFTCISNLNSHRRSHKATCGAVPNSTKKPKAE